MKSLHKNYAMSPLLKILIKKCCSSIIVWDLPFRNFYKSTKRGFMNFLGGVKRGKKAVNEDGGLQAPLVLCVGPLRALTDTQ